MSQEVIEGRLSRHEDFGEVLLDMGERRVTGFLKVQANDAGGHVIALRVHFLDGEIVQVDSPTRPDHWRLGQMLVRGGLVTASDVDAALGRAQARQKQIGAVLVGQKKLEQDQLEAMLEVQFMEALHRAVPCVDGGWRFKSREVIERAGAPPPLLPEEIVERGRIQHEHWDTIRALVPNSDVAFVKTIRGPIPEDQAQANKVGSQELLLFSLIHPTRTVGDLVMLARLETFEVCRSLAILTHGGFVAMDERSAAATGPTLKGQETNEERLKKAAAFHSFTVVLVVACLAVGVGIFLSMRQSAQNEENKPSGISVSNDSWREALTMAQVERIHVALEVYRQRTGDYPVRLGVLVDEKLLEDGDLHYPDYERPYRIKLNGESYRLIRPKK